MTPPILTDRRHALALLALALVPAAAAAAPEAAGRWRDFDFFFGAWTVRHRRLKVRLAGSQDWEEFDGETTCVPLLGGAANLNDSLVRRPSGAYRSLGLRAFDPKTGTWADWSLDGRDPTHIDAPNVGRFENGVGAFVSDDTFQGRPIKIRGAFSSINPDLAQWEQAFSPDGGQTWETNYVMRYARRA